jgi:DNA-binding LacI/PurR family transcriptional regulator
MDTRIAVGIVNLSGSFIGVLHGFLKKQLRPGEVLAEAVTHVQDDSPLARQRLLELLEGETKPVALIAICIVPGPAVVKAYANAGAPVVIIDEEAPGCSTVATDNFAGGQLAARRLLDSGRRALAMISGRSELAGGFSARERQRGFSKVLAEAGVPFGPEDLVEVQNYSSADGVNALAKFLDRKPKLDGVFSAAGDKCAAGILSAARDRGIKVPDQLAVVGFDDIPLAAIADPPITTIRQPIEEMVAAAFRLATEGGATLIRRPQRMLLPPQLVARQSA